MRFNTLLTRIKRRWESFLVMKRIFCQLIAQDKLSYFCSTIVSEFWRRDQGVKVMNLVVAFLLKVRRFIRKKTISVTYLQQQQLDLVLICRLYKFILSVICVLQKTVNLQVKTNFRRRSCTQLVLVRQQNTAVLMKKLSHVCHNVQIT